MLAAMPMVAATLVVMDSRISIFNSNPNAKSQVLKQDELIQLSQGLTMLTGNH